MKFSMEVFEISSDVRPILKAQAKIIRQLEASEKWLKQQRGKPLSSVALPRRTTHQG